MDGVKWFWLIIISAAAIFYGYLFYVMSDDCRTRGGIIAQTPIGYKCVQEVQR